MKATQQIIKKINKRNLVLFLSAVIVLFITAIAMGHGGKKHATGEFTALKALQEATKLYDRLVTNGKLVESWETALNEVKISTRSKSDKKELVVSFHRSKGDPKTVYIFFSDKGKYAGSNFTGE